MFLAMILGCVCCYCHRRHKRLDKLEAMQARNRAVIADGGAGTDEANPPSYEMITRDDVVRNDDTNPPPYRAAGGDG